MRINKEFFSSLRWTIAFAYLLVIGIGFVIVNISIMKIFEDDMISTKKKAFQKYAIEVAVTVSDDFYNVEPSLIYKIQELADEIAQTEKESTRILLLSSNGIVSHDSYNIISSDSNNAFLGRNLKNHFEVVQKVLKGENAGATDLYIRSGIPPQKKRVLYAFAPIIHGHEGVIGAVAISTSLSSYERILSKTQDMLNIFTAIVSFSIIIISFAISGFITKPIKTLTDVIKMMSQGHLDQRVSIHGSAELRQLGLAFNSMSEKLENLDKARNEFVSNASHELKTPLSAIKVLTESLIHMETEDPDIYKEFLMDINNEIDRLNAIITDLLSLVHIDDREAGLKLETVELSNMVQRVIKKLMLLAEQKNILIETFFDDSLSVQVDVAKIQQVISNIIDNAIKYTPEGGRVTVEVYKGPDIAVIKVSDTGIGIPQEDINLIFDRFFRVDKARSRATGGTGLGLSIAHRLVLLHGGNIRVTSKEGKGTTFYIELPMKI